jgi:eukaryotic-like serine/threonine-protein kinase
LAELEEAIEQFEDAWQSDDKPVLREFLRAHAIPLDASIGELIKIDMEYRWRRAPSSDPRQSIVTAEPMASHGFGGLPWRPSARDYIHHFGEAVSITLPPVDWVAEEYRIRKRWGDDPDRESFLRQHPHAIPDLAGLLREVDDELQQRRSFLQRPKTLQVDERKVRILAAEIQPGDRLDDFQILNELGQGAFARVFLAQQISMQRFVALKVSDQKSDESPVLAQLDHPNIVRVFDERTVSGLQLVYMQYVAGGNLRQLMHHWHALPPDRWTGESFAAALREQHRNDPGDTGPVAQEHEPADATTVVAQLGSRLAEALAHAHARGIIHCDIKPENVLLAADGNPLLADFNLSFGNESLQLRTSNRVGGTLAFMSPEQLEVLQGNRVATTIGPSSDIYSLAIVLRNLLTAHSPMPEVTIGATLQHAIATQLEHRKRLSPQPWTADQRMLGRVLDQCLAYEPSQRPSSAAAVQRQLEWCRLPPICSLLMPVKGSWIDRLAPYPGTSMVAFGLASSALLSPLNIWANSTIAIEGFDRSFFLQRQIPVLNAILFPTGLILGAILLRPVLGALRNARNGIEDESVRSRGAIRCLDLPLVLSLMVLALWAASGIAFPLWNAFAADSHVQWIDSLGFFVSQILHGVIAACLAMVLLSTIILRVVYPRLIARHESPQERQHLERLSRALFHGNSILEVTPLFALLAILAGQQLDRRVILALALVGFVGHLAASSITPRIQSWIDWYRLALSPTRDLARHRLAAKPSASSHHQRP